MGREVEGFTLSVAYVDTHLCIFLHAGDVGEISKEALRQVESNDLLISPMVLLELGYLFRKKKVNAPAPELFATLNSSFGISLCTLPFTEIAMEALNIEWVSDPFDRIIVANAKINNEATLITRDRLIRKNYPPAVW